MIDTLHLAEKLYKHTIYGEIEWVEVGSGDSFITYFDNGFVVSSKTHYSDIDKFVYSIDILDNDENSVIFLNDIDLSKEHGKILYLLFLSAMEAYCLSQNNGRDIVDKMLADLFAIETKRLEDTERC